MPVTVRNLQRLHRVGTAPVRQIAEHALASLGTGNSDLSIVLVDDARMRQFNRQFHATDAATDVLSFDYGNGVGEIIISVEHAVARSYRYDCAPGSELALYIVHGILHLHGFDDLVAGKRRQMRAAERRQLRALAKLVDLPALLPVG